MKTGSGAKRRIFDFCTAICNVSAGKKVAREAWDEGVCLIPTKWEEGEAYRYGWTQRMADGELNTDWRSSDEDMFAQDWYVVDEQ